MKLLFFCFLITLATNLKAQKTTTDSIANFTHKELNLSPEQKIVVKKMIWEYKQEDRKRRRELRHRMFMILKVNQQMAVRRWWKRQLRH